MKIFSILINCLFLLFLLTGCTRRITDFTFISTKNLDLSKVGGFERGKARTKGEDKHSIVIVIPLGEPNAKEAVDQAIEKVPGAVALLDGVLYSHLWYIPYVYGEAKFEVEGTPLIDPSIKP